MNSEGKHMPKNASKLQQHNPKTAKAIQTTTNQKLRSWKVQGPGSTNFPNKAIRRLVGSQIDRWKDVKEKLVGLPRICDEITRSFKELPERNPVVPLAWHLGEVLLHQPKHLPVLRSERNAATPLSSSINYGINCFQCRQSSDAWTRKVSCTNVL